MSFSRPALSALIERGRLDIESWIEGATTRLRRSFLDVLARMHGGALDSLYGKTVWASKQILPDQADSDMLARHADFWGKTKKAAYPGTGNVRFSGTAGTSIATGTVLVALGNVQYRTTVDAEVGGGSTAVVAVEAVEVGAIATINAGAELTLASPIAGISSTVLVEAGGLSSGGNEESDESLLNRVLLRVRTPPQGGSKSDYVQWALALDGVTRAWPYPLWLGAGTVGLAFVMDDRDNIFPTPTDVAAVQAALDVLRPVTADLTVFAPAARPVPMTIILTPSTTAVREAVLAEIDDMFLRDAEPGGTVYPSKISEAISIATGESHHVLSIPAAPIVLNPGELPVRGAVTWG